VDGLVKFLAERFAEDWSAARDRELVARLDTSRETRDIDAKRAILARYIESARGELPEWQAGRELLVAATAILAGVLRDFGSVYSDHPDYDASWASGA
jgi:hypothetical protein